MFSALGVAVTIWLMWFTDWPLGVDGEWTWKRHAGFGSLLEAADRLLPALLSGSVLVFWARYGERRIDHARRLQTVSLYSVLLLIAGLWITNVQTAAPQSHRNIKPYWVLYDPGASGYFMEAAFEISSVDVFLAGYEERMQEGEVLHVGTHPPGLFLLSSFCLNACETSPQLVSFLNAFENRDVREAFHEVESAAHLRPPLNRTQLPALQMLSGLTTLFCILTVVPIAVLARLCFPRRTAWIMTCLCTTAPCLAVFLPKSDLLFPLTGTAILVLAVAAMQGGRWLWLSIPAGVMLWLGLTLSLAHLPVVAVLIAYSGFRIVFLSRGSGQGSGSALISPVSAATTAATVFSLMVVVVALLCVWFLSATGCNLWNVWQLNLKNHSGFYDQFPRTWWKWLFENPLELSFALGLPLAGFAAAGVLRCSRQLFSHVRSPLVADAGLNDNKSQLLIRVPLCLAIALTWAALWISGKNQGEAARLWCFLVPWFALCAGGLLETLEHAAVRKRAFPESSVSSQPDLFRQTTTVLLACQLAASLATVSRVSGFCF